MRVFAIAAALSTLTLTTPVHADDPVPWVPVVAFATSGAGIIVGTMAGIATLRKKTELEERCPTQCTVEQLNDAVEIADASTAGFAIAGIAAVIGTVTLLLHLYAVGEDEATNIDLRVGPGGVRLQVSF